MWMVKFVVIGQILFDRMQSKCFRGTALLSINSFYYFKGKLTRKAFFLPGTGRLGK